jgi:putative PIN family toxin of toxin-antitoxin system
LELVWEGRFKLFLSPQILSEVRSVTARPKIAVKLRVRPARIERFISSIESAGELVETFPHVFVYQRDPLDAHYVNLALAAGAGIIVSRDKDLLELKDRSKPDGRRFHDVFPTLRIVDPVSFLKEFDKK